MPTAVVQALVQALLPGLIQALANNPALLTAILGMFLKGSGTQPVPQPQPTPAPTPVPVPLPIPVPPPEPPQSDASANFTHYQLGLANVWSPEHQRQNQREGRDPDSDEASPEHVQAIREGREKLWPTSRIRMSADPMPNPSAGPSHPTWVVSTPIGPVEFTLDQDGETKATGPGDDFVWMIPRLFETSRGCYVTFRLTGDAPKDSKISFQLVADEQRKSDVVVLGLVQGRG